MYLSCRSCSLPAVGFETKITIGITAHEVFYTTGDPPPPRARRAHVNPYRASSLALRANVRPFK